MFSIVYTYGRNKMELFENIFFFRKKYVVYDTLGLAIRLHYASGIVKKNSLLIGWLCEQERMKKKKKRKAGSDKKAKNKGIKNSKLPCASC